MTSPAPTGQDGEGMVSEKMVRRAVAAYDRAPIGEAVAPDIAAQAKRECAEELRALTRLPYIHETCVQEARELADRWSRGLSDKPAGGQRSGT